MPSLSLPGISSSPIPNQRQLQVAPVELTPPRKTVHFSGLRTDVFERHIQNAKPVSSFPRFGAWPSPNDWNIARAKELSKTTDPYDTAFFRNENSYLLALPLILKLKRTMDKPLEIVIDGDYRGKDAASLISLLHAETRKSYEALARNFVITRRDVHESDLEKGLSLNDLDTRCFQDLLACDQEKFTPIIKKLGPAVLRDEKFKKALGTGQQVDITDPTLPLPPATKNVRFAMQILHGLSPKQRLEYVKMLAKTQAPGSLLVLGTNEMFSYSMLLTKPEKIFAHSTDPENTSSQLSAMLTMAQMHRELEKLGYQAKSLSSDDAGRFNLTGLNFNDYIYVYEKVEDKPVPERKPEIETLIHSQAFKDHPEFAIRMSQQGFDDVNARHPLDEQTLLCLAARKGLFDVAKALLAAGAKTNVQNGKGQTPLKAAKKNDTAMKALLNESST